MTRKVLLCGAAGFLAAALACSKSTTNPSSSSPAAQPETGAAADGSTLKSTIPAIVSPTGGTQITDPTVLTAGKAAGKYQDVPLSYRFQVRSGTTVVYDSGVTGGVGSGNNVTHTVPSPSLTPDTNYTWRVRAEYQGAFGSWSSDASFRSPVGAFIRGNELRDPLTIGRTVGSIVGPAQFVAGKGLELTSQEGHVRYALPTTLDAGEFSMMVMGIDEGSPGDKTKVLSMQEGFDDLTTNRYRFTLEKRGRAYVNPGAVTFRIISGNPDHNSGRVNDGFRTVVPLNDETWYFWKATWGGNRSAVEVRIGSPTGQRIYHSEVTMGGGNYRPNPHILYLGSPVGRAGAIDASIPGAIYRDVYAGPGPRPTFPQ